MAEAARCLAMLERDLPQADAMLLEMSLIWLMMVLISSIAVTAPLVTPWMASIFLEFAGSARPSTCTVPLWLGTVSVMVANGTCTRHDG